MECCIACSQKSPPGVWYVESRDPRGMGSITGTCLASSSDVPCGKIYDSECREGYVQSEEKICLSDLAIAVIAAIPSLWLVNMIAVGIFARRKGLNKHPAFYVAVALICGCFVWICAACASRKSSTDDRPKQKEYPLAPSPTNFPESIPHQPSGPHPIHNPYPVVHDNYHLQGPNHHPQYSQESTDQSTAADARVARNDVQYHKPNPAFASDPAERQPVQQKDAAGRARHNARSAAPGQPPVSSTAAPAAGAQLSNNRSPYPVNRANPPQSQNHSAKHSQDATGRPPVSITAAAAAAAQRSSNDNPPSRQYSAPRAFEGIHAVRRENC
jgi:hypothetical protein